MIHMTKRRWFGVAALFLLVGGVVAFILKPDMFAIRLVPKEERFNEITIDLGKALEHYYDMNGRYPTTENEEELLSTLKEAMYLPKDATVRAGEFEYNPINRGQRYELIQH